MSADQVESFLSMFSRKPKSRLEQRRESEADAQKSPKQLNRKAERTAQVNFRCSPDFRDRLKDVVERQNSSMADVLEEALALYLKSLGNGAPQ